MRSLLILLFLMWPLQVVAEPLVLDSGTRQVQLIELYTSQGCSSCPPAERFVSDLETRPGLWREFVPVAFHVDYWDYLGWKDPYATSAFSHRQRAHRAEGNLPRVYTPGFVVDGQEWYGFFVRRQLPAQRGNSHRLRASLDGNVLTASYGGPTRAMDLHVAVLGFGLQDDIQRGENRGRRLTGDFVVLDHRVHTSGNNRWESTMSLEGLSQAEKYGLAIWITPKGRLKPNQATGGWLPLR